MKKGDFLLCNDGETKVEIAGFDKTDVMILYKNKIHRRPRTCIGQTLHFLTTCKVCGEDISTLFCEKCDYCGWLICDNCGYCRVDVCERSIDLAEDEMYKQEEREQKREMLQKYDGMSPEDYEYCHSSYNLIKYDSSYSSDESDYDNEQFDYGYGGDDGPDDLYDYYYNDDYDGDDYNDY